MRLDLLALVNKMPQAPANSTVSPDISVCGTEPSMSWKAVSTSQRNKFYAEGEMMERGEGARRLPEPAEACKVRDRVAHSLSSARAQRAYRFDQRKTPRRHHHPLHPGKTRQ